MNMAEYVQQISFILGLPAADNIEGVDLAAGVQIAFQELKAYMKTPVDKTVPYMQRIDLVALNIHTHRVLYVQAAKPRLGLTMSTIESGNVFQIAAAVNTYSPYGQANIINIDPIMRELALSQVRNVLGTDLQWVFDTENQVIYISYKDPVPTHVTVRYVPDFQDVSEIENPVWIDYLRRLSIAYCKQAFGRIRGKYKVADSNVELDGDILLQEATQEFTDIRNELKMKKSRLVVLN